MKVISSPDGVVHVFERGWRHWTWCGLEIADPCVDEGQPDCLDCIGGPSHIGLIDLVRGAEVEIDLCPVDLNQRICLPPKPCVLSFGTNQYDVVWEAPQDVQVHRVAYCRKDGIVLKSTSIAPLTVRMGDTITVGRGQLVLKET